MLKSLAYSNSVNFQQELSWTNIGRYCTFDRKWSYLCGH